MKNSKFLQLESNIWSWFKIFTKQNHLWYHTKLIINDSLTVLWGKWHFAGAGFQEDNLLVQALQLLPHAQPKFFKFYKAKMWYDKMTKACLKSFSFPCPLQHPWINNIWSVILLCHSIEWKLLLLSTNNVDNILWHWLTSTANQSWHRVCLI